MRESLPRKRKRPLKLVATVLSNKTATRRPAASACLFRGFKFRGKWRGYGQEFPERNLSPNECDHVDYYDTPED
jgi:hypothetical protein